MAASLHTRIKNDFLERKSLYFIQILIKHVPIGIVNNYLSILVEIMAWHQAGNKSLSELKMAYFTYVYMHCTDSMN